MRAFFGWMAGTALALALVGIFHLGIVISALLGFGLSITGLILGDTTR